MFEEVNKRIIKTNYINSISHSLPCANAIHTSYSSLPGMTT